MRLENKVVVVTGASSGMGKAITELFVKEGAKVVAVARRKERLEELAASLKDEAGEIVIFQGDVSLKETNDKMIDTAIEKFGKLDVLINNAGIMDEFIPVGELTEEFWNKIIKVNLEGPMWAMHKAVNIMMEQKSGSIINVASIGGIQGCRSGAAYNASKSGLIGLSKNTAFMYALEGIRCNVIAPGGVNTEVSVNSSHPSQFGVKRAMAGLACNPRMGEAEEIATAALFLASDDASFVNGAVLTVDGGWIAY